LMGAVLLVVGEGKLADGVVDVAWRGGISPEEVGPLADCVEAVGLARKGHVGTVVEERAFEARSRVIIVGSVTAARIGKLLDEGRRWSDRAAGGGVAVGECASGRDDGVQAVSCVVSESVGIVGTA